jgi:RimJ/RimL family protein N-acetyltransferase
MLQFRPFLKQDLQPICSFPQSEVELFYFYPKALYPLTPEQLQSAIDQRSDSTVFVQNECIVGFANFYRWEDGVCCIGNVVVAPFARGQGVAKFIVETMISLADHRHSASTIQISCFNQNIAGLLLYKKLGFKPFDMEERECIDGKRLALIHMHYQITKTQPQL